MLTRKDNLNDIDGDSSSTVKNVLCEKHLFGEEQIAKLGFPVLSMVSESPAVINCVRYVLEVAWKDILDEYLPVETDESESVKNMHIMATSNIEKWAKKCKAKLNKLSTCHGQAAYSFEYSQNFEATGLKKHHRTCPFTLAADVKPLASLLYGPCLVRLKDSSVFLDAHVCSGLDLKSWNASGTKSTYSLSMSDIGFDRVGSGVYSAKCEVFSALSLLAVLDENVDAMEGNGGVTDMPELSLRFVLAVIAPFTTDLLDAADVTDSFELPKVNGNNGRRSGIMGTHSGYDFLFPSLAGERKTLEEMDDTVQDEQKASNRASSQCFESFAYWPQEWQAPFGEIIHDTYEHAAAFGNYMALLEADPVECAARMTDRNGDNSSCFDRLIVLPDHLRIENMSANVFGSSGVCREHSFGMPTLKTNTHSLCTSSTSHDESNSEETDIFECNSEFDDKCACSEDGEVNVGGGMGDSLGHLWPLLKIFLNSDEAPPIASESASNLIPNYTLNSSFMKSVSIGFLSMFMDLHAKINMDVDTSIDEIVRNQCYGSERYTVDSPQNVRCAANIAGGILGTELCCEHNSDCQIYDAGLVCSVQGVCVEMLIEVENTLDESIEMGLNSPGCSNKDQDAFSGASPWRRMNSMMEQHGMCSHSNRVSHERMDDVFENYSAKQGACSAGFDELAQESFWVCNRSAVNWTWVRERPDFGPDNGNPLCRINSRDMRDKHTPCSVLDEGSFDMEPHLCDSDYMHSNTFGWCGLQHNDITEKSMMSSNSRWMRTAPLHSQFSMMRPSRDDASVRLLADSGVQESERAPRNKMRFMGMRHDMLQYKQNQAKVLQNIAIQKCASLGLCQTEVFTSAGVHQQPRRKPMSGIAIPVNSTATVDLLKNNSMKAADMDECGPMGYIQPKHLQAPTGGDRCVLDRGVAVILYLIKAQADEGDGACANLYGAPAFSTHGLLEEQNGDLSYEYDNREIVRDIQVYMNGFILLESVEKSSRSPLLGISQDTRALQDISTKIHRCASDLQDFIEQQPKLYPNKKASGLYVMLDFGTYEIPMLWWLKFALSKRVFLTQDTSPTAISVQALNGDLPLPLNSFTHRLAARSVLSSGNMPSDLTLGQFWSRINANEMGIWFKAHEFISRSLAEYVESSVQTSVLMGCVEDFSVDFEKIVLMQQRAKVSEVDKKRNQRVEKMLDSVFGDNNTYPIWADAYSTASVSNDALTSFAQFEMDPLFGHQNGLDSILKFDSSSFREMQAGSGLISYIFQKIVDESITVEKYSPLKNADNVAIFDRPSDSNTAGIKILDISLEAILTNAKRGNFIRNHIEDYLKEYDEIFEARLKTQKIDSSNMIVPKFGMKCTRDLSSEASYMFSTSSAVKSQQCAEVRREHCIFDRDNLDSLKEQGDTAEYQSQISIPATVELYETGSPIKKFNEIDMCKKTPDSSLFGYSNPIQSRDNVFSRFPDGGRCTLADLKSEYGAGKDFAHGTSLIPNFEPLTVINSGFNPSCNEAEDIDPPVYRSSIPSVDLSDSGLPMYVGQEHLQNFFRPSDQEMLMPARPINKLCHRIDSACVQKGSFPMPKLFGGASHPVDLKYNSLEDNAFTQVYIAIWCVCMGVWVLCVKV